MREKDDILRNYLPASDKTFENFTDTLDLILGKHRLDIFSAETFSVNAKTQSGRKLLGPPALFGGGVFVLISALFAFDNTLWGMGGILIGTCVIGYSVDLKNKPSSDSYSKLLQGANEPAIAQIVLRWVQWCLASDIPLFQNDKKAKAHPIPGSYREAPNMALVLLGDDRHRQALGVKHQVSDNPFMYNRQDTQKLFGPLIEALSQTPQYSNFRPKTAAPRDEDAVMSTSFYEHPFTKASSSPPAGDIKIEDDFHFAQRSKDARQHEYFITVLLDRALLKRFIDKADSDPDLKAAIASSAQRKKWLKAFKYIYQHWEVWQAYRDKQLTDDTRKFKKLLFGADILNYSSSETQTQFRRGRNLYINKLIAQSRVIKTSELITDRTIKK